MKHLKNVFVVNLYEENKQKLPTFKDKDLEKIIIQRMLQSNKDIKKNNLNQKESSKKRTKISYRYVQSPQ